MLDFDPLTVAWGLLGLAGGALVLYAAALVATWMHMRRRPERAPDDALPPVSLLKPLKGLEDGFDANLRSFFAQRYPASLEILFSATEADDPGLARAKELALEFPDVPVRFIVSDPDFGLNPKVANLAGALRAARYDLVHQSDANVRVPPTYLRDIVGEMVASRASMLTSPVVGVGEATPGAAMENLQLSAFIAPAMCLALKAVRITCVCGKSMLFHRSELEADFGGLASVRNVLCEDFVLGERYKAAGRRLVLSVTPVENVNRDCGVDRFLERHGRWLKMRATLHVPGFVADLLSNPIALAALAVLLSGFDRGILGAAALLTLAKAAADQVGVRLTREPLPLRYAWLGPAKDLLLLPLWLSAVFGRTVIWRGQRLRFGKNTELLPLDPGPGDAGLAPQPTLDDAR
ncbi:MAG: glycosyltransferase [Myxococcota bacterium]